MATDAKAAVIICGSRHWDETYREPVRQVLSLQRPGTTIITGDAKGVDTLAFQVASEMGFWTCVFEADWHLYGKKAGPIRNKKMLDYLLQLMREGYAVGVIALHDDPSLGKGTAHMVKIAAEAGVPVHTMILGEKGDDHGRD